MILEPLENWSIRLFYSIMKSFELVRNQDWFMEFFIGTSRFFEGTLLGGSKVVTEKSTINIIFTERSVTPKYVRTFYKEGGWTLGEVVAKAYQVLDQICEDFGDPEYFCDRSMHSLVMNDDGNEFIIQDQS